MAERAIKRIVVSHILLANKFICVEGGGGEVEHEIHWADVPFISNYTGVYTKLFTCCTWSPPLPPRGGQHVTDHESEGVHEVVQSQTLRSCTKFLQSLHSSEYGIRATHCPLVLAHSHMSNTLWNANVRTLPGQSFPESPDWLPPPPPPPQPLAHALQ